MVTLSVQEQRKTTRVLTFPTIENAIGFAIQCIQKFEQLVDFDISITQHNGQTVIHKKSDLDRYCVIKEFKS